MRERKLAKCKGFDFGIEDHGFPVLLGQFEYEDGSVQSLGYAVDAAFLMRFLSALGERELSKVNGKSCWVECDWGGIYKIEPLHKKDGRVFDIGEWIKWHDKLPHRPSAYEMLHGTKG